MFMTCGNTFVIVYFLCLLLVPMYTHSKYLWKDESSLFSEVIKNNYAPDVTELNPEHSCTVFTKAQWCLFKDDCS